MAQPIVKYTLNKKGQVPEWINTGDSSFSGQHGISGNKDGYIPRYESPQDTIYLGIAIGDVDPEEPWWLSKISLVARNAELFLQNRVKEADWPKDFGESIDG